MLPSLDISKVEGNARPTAPTSNKALIIGPCSAGVKETTIYTFANPNSIESSIGYGNAQIAAQLFLARSPSGFGSVDVLVASGSGTTITAVETASPTITPTGTPFASYDLRAEVTTAGVTGSCKIKYSLDGGNTYSESQTVSSSGELVIPYTGVTLSFGSGTHAEGNTIRYDIQGPMMSTTDLANCINTLSNSNSNYTVILVADDSPAPASGSALFAAMDTHLTTLDNEQYKFTQAVVNVGGESKLFNRSYSETPGTRTSSTVLSAMSAYAASEGNFISAVAEKVNTYVASPKAGYARPRLPFAFSYAAECHAVGRDISKNVAASQVRGVETPSYDEFRDGSVYHDEKIVAPRTFAGEAGIYVNQALLKSAANSTYDIWPKGRVVSRAAEVVKAALRPFLHTRVRTLTDGTGRIDPRDQATIETAVNKQLRAALLSPTNGQGTQGHCTGLLFSINGENNLLLTGELEGTTLVVPFAYPSSISVQIALTDSIPVIPV